MSVHLSWIVVHVGRDRVEDMYIYLPEGNFSVRVKYVIFRWVSTSLYFPNHPAVLLNQNNAHAR